ncbi:MAG: sensor histidine kinase KdpD [Spirochaetales bacterium]|nr:sensor histidine kinase KdpD [Spirochaetales bacterium]
MHDNKSPDELLAEIERERQLLERPILKVFLGMSAGVGKTFAMLQAARQLELDGEDVVVGYVETHGRPETNALLEGLEILPRKKVHYRNLDLEEFDLEAAISRRPRYLIVDELPHSNAPGLHHSKRYQDVLELLNQGINVFTAINIQHLESQVQAVHELSGIQVRETVPDSFFEKVTDIEVIDITPDELLRRFHEGKVYIPEQAQMAVMRFFRRENLALLRRLALDYAAAEVEREMLQLEPRKNLGHRFLVAIGPDSGSEYLIRHARRAAQSRNAPWIALHVSSQGKLTATENQNAEKHLKLAAELGAEIMTISAENPAVSIIEIAQARQISRLFVGQPRKRPWYLLLARPSLPEALMRLRSDIDLYIVALPEQQTLSWKESLHFHSSLSSYLYITLILGSLTFINSFLLKYVDPYTISLVYLFCIAVLGMFFSRGPIMLGGLMAAFSWNFFFLDPRHTFHIARTHDALTFLVLLIVSLVTGSLTSRLKAKESSLLRREKFLAALFELMKAISNSDSKTGIIKRAEERFGAVFKARTTIYLFPDSSSADATNMNRDEAVARWVFKNSTVAGRYTDTLQETEKTFLPLISGQQATGVLGITLGKKPAREDWSLLQAMAGLVALYLDRLGLKEMEKKLDRSLDSERLFLTVLHSLSHELRTPLTSIRGAAETLSNTEKKDQSTSALLQDILDSAEVMNHLIANLLDMSRIESGGMKLNIMDIDLPDLVNNAIERLSGLLANRRIEKEFPEHHSPLYGDGALIEQAIYNILHNVATHTPEGTGLRIRMAETKENVRLFISDQGPALSPDLMNHIFQKFYKSKQSHGLGLGMSIARGIVEAHGGKVDAYPGKTGGLSVLFDLPRQPEGI